MCLWSVAFSIRSNSIGRWRRCWTVSERRSVLPRFPQLSRDQSSQYIGACWSNRSTTMPLRARTPACFQSPGTFRIRIRLRWKLAHRPSCRFRSQKSNGSHWTTLTWDFVFWKREQNFRHLCSFQLFAFGGRFQCWSMSKGVGDNSNGFVDQENLCVGFGFEISTQSSIEREI